MYVVCTTLDLSLALTILARTAHESLLCLLPAIESVFRPSFILETMSAKYKEQFPDNVFVSIAPPEKHPLYKYGGFHPGRITTLPKGHVKESGYQAFPLDVIFEQDKAVSMRDGIKIYTDIYRPKTESKVPAILAWSPYGKGGADNASQNYDMMGPMRMGIPYENLSGYEKFEGPNPADWCERGYAIVDPDARGCMNSEGDLYFWGPQEALDIYDTLSWIQEQSWCDGSVVMMGNSWLAISQINFAARYRHPALKAIAPWEGLTDPYKHSVCRGGRKAPPGFGDVIVAGFAGRAEAENPFLTIDKRPLYDDYWESKAINVANIDVPMYLTASYSSGIHSAGSFINFATQGKAKKWVRVHASQEWHDLYRLEANDDLQKFFDCYTKGIDNGWESTPSLRLSLLGFRDSPAKTIHERPEPAEKSFPLSRTKVQKFYLDAQDMSMSTEQPSSTKSVSFESHHFTDKVSFALKFSKYTELSGWPWLRVFMHCDTAKDMDVVVQIRKISATGQRLEYSNYYAPVPPSKLPSTNVSKYLGPSGILRASHRASLEAKQSSDDYPEYTHRTTQTIEAGKVVELEIPIWPIGMVFEQGEGIHLDIAGHDLAYPELVGFGPEPTEPVDSNEGKFFVHTGGDHGSFLMLPFITD